MRSHIMGLVYCTIVSDTVLLTKYFLKGYYDSPVQKALVEKGKLRSSRSRLIEAV